MKNKVCILLLLLSIFPVVIKAQIESSIPSDKPKLVIGIVVEQMRQDYIDRFWDNFGDKGFKRLAINGSYCVNANYNYLLTQTAPGYATIVTGAEPCSHGIVSNYWFNKLTGEKIDCIYSEKKETAVGGSKDADGRVSPTQMLSTTFSDEAKLFNRGKSKVISMSLSKYAAVLSGGYAADAAYWFDQNSGQWMTSTYYTSTLPKWVVEVNDKKMPDTYLERTWEPMLPLEKYNEVLSDSSKYEFGIDGMYKTFPYNYSDIVKTVRNYKLLTMIPEGNTLLNDLAVAAMYGEDLGKDEFTDFLFVNYSVPEEVGKLYGPQSIEVQDLFLRLDKDLEHLIDVVEDLVGKNNCLIYLTSNHGVSEMPQYLQDQKMPAGNFKQYYMLALVKSYLKAIYGDGDWILDFNNSQIYLNRSLIEDSQISLNEFREKIIDFIMNSAGIANAIGANQFQNIVFVEGMPVKMQNSYNQKRSGDIMISLKPGWIEDIPYCTDHNSGYSCNTHVPLIWYGWKVKKQKVFSQINITDIAPTVSTALGTPPPPIVSGKVLENIFLNK
ncbi:MAG: alkaline phosphatase family protein [Bacteroidales bacterium]|nr:alkaline phosphatase family protein [Bacteroidales bacterium]